MCTMLDVLDFAATRKVAILGDMGELGAEEKEMHASVGEHLKGLHIDMVITIGTLSEALHQAAVKSAPQSRCVHFADLDSFFAQSGELLRDGDSILVKASHYMDFEQIVRALSS